MSVTGYLAKSVPGLGMPKDKPSSTGIVFHGGVLGGERTLEEAQGLDAVNAALPAGEGRMRIPWEEGPERKRERYKGVADYDSVLRGNLRL